MPTSPYGSVTIHKSFTNIWRLVISSDMRDIPSTYMSSQARIGREIAPCARWRWCVSVDGNDGYDTYNLQTQNALVLHQQVDGPTAGPPSTQRKGFSSQQISLIHEQSRFAWFRYIIIVSKSTERRRPQRLWMRPRRPQSLQRRPWRLQRRSQLQLQIWWVLGKQEVCQVTSTHWFSYTGRCSKGMQQYGGSREETTEAVEEATTATADLATTQARGASSRPLSFMTSRARLSFWSLSISCQPSCGTLNAQRALQLAQVEVVRYVRFFHAMSFNEISHLF